MKTNLKSQKGAITIITLVAVLLLTTFLISTFIGIANKAQTSAETTKKIADIYNNLDEADKMYSEYLADGNTIPIYKEEDFMNMDNTEVTEFTINEKKYTRTENSVFLLMSDFTFDGNGNPELTREAIEEKLSRIKFDGMGHIITLNNQGTTDNKHNVILNFANNKAYIKAYENISENSTATLNSITNDYFINYKIYGNSKQEGTPTPDNPQEIVSLGETGNIQIKQTGKNLFNFELSEGDAPYGSIEKFDNKYVATDNRLHSARRIAITIPFKNYLKEGRTYTVKFDKDFSVSRIAVGETNSKSDTETFAKYLSKTRRQ